MPSMTTALSGGEAQSAGGFATKKRKDRESEEASFDEESRSSVDNGTSVRKRDEKRLNKAGKNNSEPIYLPQYRQVNYMSMLNDIISNDFIDDRLTKFLHILNGTMASPTRPGTTTH
jgi:hypothetical protein